MLFSRTEAKSIAFIVPAKEPEIAAGSLFSDLRATPRLMDLKKKVFIPGKGPIEAHQVGIGFKLMHSHFLICSQALVDGQFQVD